MGHFSACLQVGFHCEEKHKIVRDKSLLMSGGGGGGHQNENIHNEMWGQWNAKLNTWMQSEICKKSNRKVPDVMVEEYRPAVR